MRRGGRWKAGTNIRREPDVVAMGEALARPGMDPRVWCVRGTVATVKTDGSFDYTDTGGIVIAPRGVDVDVVIEPLDHPITCRYGLNAGAGQIFAPILPGNLVLVLLPFGDIATVPEIVKVLAGPHTPLGVEDSDQKPIFRNDRVLVYGNGYPVEIRSSSGARVVVGTDGKVNANQGTKGVARLDDATTTTVSGKAPPDPAAVGGIYALAASLLATGLFVPNPSPPAPPPDVADVDVPGQITQASGTVIAGD